MKKENMLPGWYRVNNDNHFQYFNGDFLDQTDYQVIDVSRDVDYFIGPAKPPRTKLKRFLLIIFGWLVLVSNFFIYALLFSESDSSLESSGRLVGLVLLSVLSTQVGYRWFDALFALVPIYGVYYIGKILWRATALPHRYWTLNGKVDVYDLEFLRQSSSQVSNSDTDSNELLTLDFNETVGEMDMNQQKKAHLNFVTKIQSNRLLAIVVAASLLIPSAVILTEKTGVLNSFVCGGLREEISQRDEIGRDLWNSYQREVSNLTNFPLYSSQYESQVENVARRVVQVLNNDKQGYVSILEKPNCAIDAESLNTYIGNVDEIVNYLTGKTVNSDGKFWKPYFGWNTNYYNEYQSLLTLLK